MEDNNLFPSSSSKNTEFDVKPFIVTLRSWLWLAVLIAVVIGVIAFMFSRSKKPVYTATSLLVVSGFSSSGSTNTDVVTAGEKLAISYSHLLSSSEIINNALSRVGGSISYGDIKDGISVTPVQDSQLVEVSVEYKDPVMAAQIANSIVDVFIERLKSDYAANTAEERANLRVRIQDLSLQISSLQNEIQRQIASNHEERLKLLNNSMQALQVEINQINDEIASLSYVTLIDTRDRFGYRVLVTATPSIENQRILAVKNGQLLQRQDILRQYQQEYVLLSTNGDSTSNADVTISQIQAYLDRLQAQYLTLQQNLASLQPSNLQKPPSLTQVYRADVPKSPKGPNSLVYAFLGFLTGLLLSVIGIYAVVLLDPHIKNPDLIPQKYGLPVLASYFKSHPTGKTLMQQRQSNSQIYEACRLIQIQIFKEEGNDSILLTSPTARDDKTTLAANLAVVMAESGKRTLLLDTVHNSAIPGLFNKANAKGLGEYLSSSVESLDEVVIPTEFPCLYLMCAGALTPALMNQFNAENGQRLIARLKERFEFVVINSSSVLSTIDALLLAPIVKSVLLVVNPEKSTREDLDQCVKTLTSVEAKIMGVVFANLTSQLYRYYFPALASRKSAR